MNDSYIGNTDVGISVLEVDWKYETSIYWEPVSIYIYILSCVQMPLKWVLGSTLKRYR